MEDVYPKPVINILEAIKFSEMTFDQRKFRRKILGVITKNFHLDGALFILPDVNARFTHIMLENIDDIWSRKYRDHYHRYDPLKLISGAVHGKPIIRMEEIVDFSSFVHSAYYNDFMLPQKIYHKVYSCLISGKKTQGVIGFCRSKGSPSFSKEDINMISTVSPFIAHALDHITLQNIKTLQDNIVSIIGNNGYGGVLIFDDAMNLIFMNEEAKKMCPDLEGCGSNRNCSGYSSVPQILLKDCLALRDEHKKGITENHCNPRYRIIKSQSAQNFALYSKIFDKTIYSKHYRLYVASLEKINNGPYIKESRVKELYHLTDREMDILSQLSKGLKNAEIACELFVSEITVKKHIQKIFKKTGVKNRTSLIHKTMIEPNILQ